MKFLYITLFILGYGFTAHAQDIGTGNEDAADSDEIQKAIDEFNRLKREGRKEANDVTVVLDPPEISTVPAPAEDSEPETVKKAPVLVNGTPPETSEDSPAEIIQETVAEAESTPPVVEESGPSVRVQSIRKGDGKIDPDKIKLRASFPAKPLSDAPSGWNLAPDKNAPPFSKDVEIRPGTFISLSISPYVLSPDADGTSVFSVSEPGYDPQNSYSQELTVGAILGESIEQLDQDSVKMGNVISDLHQLLASLPKSENTEEPSEKQ